MSTIDEESAKKVFRQVEFYFSDSNLPKDQFLLKSISESEDGMVSLALICSFSKMKSHLGLVASSADEIPVDIIKAVADTLKPSQHLKISDDGMKVGRKVELAKVEELLEQQDSRTIAVSPLPYDVTLEAVESFFAQHAKVNSVRLPTHVSNKKIFCGTALVEFSSDEDVEKMMKQKLAYAGADLEFKPKKEFDEEREKQAATVVPHGHNSPPEPSYPKGLILAFTLKSTSSKDDTAKSSELVKPESDSGEDKKNDEENGNEVTNPETDGKGDAEEEKKSPGDADEEKKSPGEDADEKKSPEDADEKDEKTVQSEVRYNYMKDKDNQGIVFREDLKGVFGKFGSIKFVDFSAGANSGYIRFEEADASHKARAAAAMSDDAGLVVKNFIATLEPLTGEAEKEYWNTLDVGKERFRDNRGNRGGRGEKFNRRGGKRGRYRDNDSGGRPYKNRRVAA